MPTTTLDPRTALVVVDLQRSVVSHDFPGTRAVVTNAARLAAGFRAAGLPVVLVNVAGGAPGRTDGAAASGSPAAPSANALEFAPELGQQPSDIVITKNRWGAFTETGLDMRLRERGVTQVVVVGIATSYGVESTARHAHELGYHVTLPSDAMTDLTPEGHENALARVFPALGEVRTTDEVIAALPGE